MSGREITHAAAVRLDVLCNDPDNGLFAHRAEGLQVTTWDGEPVMFTCRRARAPKFLEVFGGFRFMRLRWEVLGSKDWFGNWRWNAYWLSPEDAVSLLGRVKASDMFSCDHGPSGLFENWGGEGVLNRDLWLANLWGRHSIGVVDVAA